ncbi:MAPEG family protein [Paraurantiacibacter namhicola]|uniref:MAPEG family protein n=2 Tax=Paraurantiacibacter namhicola TaxID=645517 RepID=A0A1C7D6X2_9SPHN|nr:MAPEG family protein [Paraurantiacibacter namhicola]ANU07102.1 MAPEG family protein [Paraurantiacibacter namhicola]
MPAEILVLALACVLLFVHVQVAIHKKTAQYGVDWNMGPRDEDTPPLNDVAARLERARDNFLETFPVAIVALFGVVLADKSGPVTEAAAWTWLGARAVYLPLYWSGVHKWRTVVFGISAIALLVLLGVLIFG